MYLAHLGSFVPCEKAVVGLTDRIFTRIASAESVSVAQSSFTIDLTQMATMMHNATSRSLCLVDEFGKGTNPVGRSSAQEQQRLNDFDPTTKTDGISLLTAVTRQFCRSKCKVTTMLIHQHKPLGNFTTRSQAFVVLHLTEIFNTSFIDISEESNIATFKMEVHRTK